MLHTDIEDTWIARRVSGHTTLLEASENGQVGPAMQWLTSVYFTLTVFTSVGFGDISAFTCGEMIYACFSMILGCIVNGIVLSTVITILATDNEEQRLLAEQERGIRNFGKHMHVADVLTEELTKWASTTKMMDHSNYNRADVKQLLTSGILPRELMLILPHALFNGRLTQNKFVKAMIAAYPLETPGKTPAQLPVLLALECTNIFYIKEQLVYSVQDHAWNIYFILHGTFSYLAKCFKGQGSGSHFNGDMSKDNTDSLEVQTVSATRRALKVVKPTSSSSSTVAPYQPFGWGDYFGDLEIILSSIPRVSSARCETDHGSVLTLHKKDMFALVEEYPLLITHWRAAALLRERRRASHYRRRIPVSTVQELAANIIQRHWRALLVKRSRPMRPMSSFMSGDAYARLAHRLKSDSTQNRMRSAPAEIVPSYARDLQVSVDDVRSDIGDLREEFRSTFMTEMQSIKEALTQITGIRCATTV